MTARGLPAPLPFDPDHQPRLVAAWDLIGQEGCFRIQGGTQTYEAVMYNEATARGIRPRLARLEAVDGGIVQINRWVDPDTIIEVFESDEQYR